MGKLNAKVGIMAYFVLPAGMQYWYFNLPCCRYCCSLLFSFFWCSSKPGWRAHFQRWLLFFGYPKSLTRLSMLLEELVTSTVLPRIWASSACAPCSALLVRLPIKFYLSSCIFIKNIQSKVILKNSIKEFPN